MGFERTIIQKLYESRKLSEAEFNSGGSTYRSAFGRYHKDDEEISRDEYFDAKDTSQDNTPIEDISTEAAEWEGGYPWDDDLFFKNAEKLGLETGSEDIKIGDKMLDYDYAILDRPFKFYHATLPDNLEGIKQSGLMKTKQGSDGNKNIEAVYLSGSKEGISQWRGKNTRIVTVTLPAGTKVYQDRQSNAVFVRDDIPKELIKTD